MSESDLCSEPISELGKIIKDLERQSIFLLQNRKLKSSDLKQVVENHRELVSTYMMSSAVRHFFHSSPSFMFEAYSVR